MYRKLRNNGKGVASRNPPPPCTTGQHTGRKRYATLYTARNHNPVLLEDVWNVVAILALVHYSGQSRAPCCQGHKHNLVSQVGLHIHTCLRH